MGKFKHGYLLALQQHDSYDGKVKSSDCYLKNGDAAIVKNENVPRLYWRKRRIMKLRAGHDDVIRGFICESLPKEQ